MRVASDAGFSRCCNARHAYSDEGSRRNCRAARRGAILRFAHATSLPQRMTRMKRSTDRIPDDPCRQPAAARRSVRHDAGPDGRQARRRGRLCRARTDQGRRRTACGSRSMPGWTSSTTARWASRASSPTRRSALTGWRSAKASGRARSPTRARPGDFPEYYQSDAAEQVSARRRRALMVCAGPIKYKGHEQLKADLDGF